MEFHTQPFNNPHHLRLNSVGYFLMRPEELMVNYLLSWFKLTTREDTDRYEEPCYERYVYITFITPVLTICLIIYFPVFFLGFILWAPVQSRRNPYVLHINNSILNSIDDRCTRSVGNVFIKVLTADTSLYPEFWSRKRNLSHTKQRAVRMGEKILGKNIQPGKLLTGGIEPNEQTRIHSKEVGEGALVSGTSSYHSELDLAREHVAVNSSILGNTLGSIVTHLEEKIPQDADIILLQGVFDIAASQLLRSTLSTGFAFVVDDVTHNAWGINRFRWCSGLMLASRIAPAFIDFQAFKGYSKGDRYMTAGFLIAEFDMGQGDMLDEPVRLCVINTQLEEGYGTASIETRNNQMSQINDYLQERSRLGGAGHLTTLCGNLNFHAAKGEVANANHSFYQTLTDPCEGNSEYDHTCLIGTELQTENIHDKPVSTPGNLLRSLATDGGRVNYLVEDSGTNLEAGSRAKSRWRRSTKILYRTNSALAEKMEVVNFQIFTDFSTMTPHLPIASTFSFMKNVVKPKPGEFSETL